VAQAAAKSPSHREGLKRTYLTFSGGTEISFGRTKNYQGPCFVHTSRLEPPQSQIIDLDPLFNMVLVLNTQMPPVTRYNFSK
jgi:hypothetical protein